VPRSVSHGYRSILPNYVLKARPAISPNVHKPVRPRLASRDARYWSLLSAPSVFTSGGGDEMHATPTRRAAMPRGLVAVVSLLLCAAAAGAADPAGSAPQETPQATALDLSGVAPNAGPAGGGGAAVASDTFAPPGVGQPQVVELDADALFAALVNHTVRILHLCILRMGGST
jgi:hypothetical protein